MNAFRETPSGLIVGLEHCSEAQERLLDQVPTEQGDEHDTARHDDDVRQMREKWWDTVDDERRLRPLRSSPELDDRHVEEIDGITVSTEKSRDRVAQCPGRSGTWGLRHSNVHESAEEDGQRRKGQSPAELQSKET